ncbi:MAG: hypothetical protein KF861_06640 [Planctomycetaceae bacterium]|nr:hypothetical protein [Planctomycetaceae bacterium]
MAAVRLSDHRDRGRGIRPDESGMQVVATAIPKPTALPSVDPVPALMLAS